MSRIQVVVRCDEIKEIAREFSTTDIQKMEYDQNFPELAQGQRLIATLLHDYYVEAHVPKIENKDNDAVLEFVLDEMQKFDKEVVLNMMEKIISFNIVHIDKERKLGIVRFRHADEDADLWEM